MSKKFTEKTGGKLVAVATSVMTTISLSGISLFAPIFVATAATIVEGDTVKTASNPDVYIVKYMGAKKFKRLILNPQVFESYKHLSWGAIKTVTQAEMDVFTVSELVRAVNDPKVYKLTSAANSDTGERHWVNMTAAEFVAAGNDWDSIYEINAVDRDNYTTSTDVTPAGVTPAPAPVGAGVTVSLASDTPAASQVAGGATDFVFAKVNFAGGANTTVTSIAITRSGLAEDNDFTAFKLWDGATQLGGSQALNTITHKATFTGLSWVVPAGTTKVLTISGTLDVLGANTATTGNTPRVGIAAAADVVATTAVSGTFPAYGSSMTIAGIGVGRLDVNVRTVPADSSPVAGATGVEIASWNFAAVTEGMSVRRIKMTQTGSASAIDVKNVMLKVDGVQIGSTVASLAADGTAVFDLSSSPYGVNAGVTKIVYLYADISSGIVTGATTRTIDFEITNAADVTVFGANSGGSITISLSGTVAFTTQSGVAQTVGQGTIPTVAVNGATNPSAQAFVNGTTQQLFSAFRFSNGVAQDVRVARLRLNLLGTATAVAISNVTLYKYDELAGTETQVGTATNFVGTVATYGADAPGLDTGIFDILKSKNVVLHVRADISTSAQYTSIEIALNEVRIDGIQSQGNMDPIVVDLVNGLAEVRTHSPNAAVGTLTIAFASTNPAAQNVVPGKLGHEYAKFNFTANGEDITVSTLVFDLQDNAVAAASGDFTNVKLLDGSTQIGSTVASPTSSVTFSVNVTVKKDTTKTFTVSADVPTNAATVWVVGGTGTRVVGDFLTGATFNSNVVATGVASTASVTATAADFTGSNMTALVGTLTISMSAIPAATTYVNSTAQASLGRLILTAGTAENLQISSITMTVDADGTFAVNGPQETFFRNVKLYDGSTVLKTLAAFTEVSADSRAAFTGLSITVLKGQQKALEIKADVIIGSNSVAVLGVEDTNSTGGADVVATGLSSNTTIYGANGVVANALIAGQVMTLANAGTLTVALGTNTAVAQQHAVGLTGKTGVDMATFTMTASNEAIDIRSIVVRVENSTDNDVTYGNYDNNFAKLALYEGATKVSNDGFLAGGIVTFNFAEADSDLAKDATKTWTIRADVNGTSNGATSGHLPQLFVGSLIAYGFSSGALADLTLVENVASTVAALTLDLALTAVATTLVVDNGADADADNTDLVGFIIKVDSDNSGTAIGASDEEMLIVSIADGATEDTYTVVRNVNGTTAQTALINAVTNVYSVAIGNPQYIYRSKPTFALVSPTTAQTLNPLGTEEVMRFTITADAGGDVIFDGTTHNIQFTISGFHADNTIDSDTLSVRRVDTNAVVGDGTPANDALDGAATGNVSTTYNVDDLSVTIAAGTFMTFKVDADLADFEDNGDTFRVSIQNAAADLSWDDNISTDITVANLNNGLPITAAAFVNPS